MRRRRGATGRDDRPGAGPGHQHPARGRRVRRHRAVHPLPQQGGLPGGGRRRRDPGRGRTAARHVGPDLRRGPGGAAHPDVLRVRRPGLGGRPGRVPADRRRPPADPADQGRQRGARAGRGGAVVTARKAAEPTVAASHRAGRPRRGRLAALVGVAVTVAVLATGCTGDGADPEPTPPVAGGAAGLPGPVPSDLALRPAPTDLPGAPKVTGTLTDGSALAVAELWADRPVVLTFFSSWCNTCAGRQDALGELAREHRDRVVFVGVAGEDDPDALQEYLRRHRVEYPVLVDGDQRIARAYAVREPPAVVVVAKGGTLLRGWPGGVDAATLDSTLRKLVLAP
ncbi:hypothetical protein C6W10_05185 [Plantactinospora sp. BB1]|nr:hypothetical protein C6W10_05185 [Plantactinospora sp. BB1]